MNSYKEVPMNNEYKSWIMDHIYLDYQLISTVAEYE